MHYARYGEWIRERVEDLVRDFGIPREDAESMMSAVEAGGIMAEAAVRADRQVLLDFERLGSIDMAKRANKSPQAMCQRRTRILASRDPKDLNPELNARLNAA
jgi:hypothetical protein